MTSRPGMIELKPDDSVVVVLGAGATKACGGPLTAEILPHAFTRIKRSQLGELERFLIKQFGMPEKRRRAEDYPQLPLLLSLLDTAIDREHGFGQDWDINKLREVRKQAEYAVFKSIEHALEENHAGTRDYHAQLFEWIYRKTQREPVIISLNYDLLADQALIKMEGGGFPDYACQIDTPGYTDAHHWGKLLKIHGSMNWIYCNGCDRLEIGIDRRGGTYKIASSIAKDVVKNAHNLQQYYQKQEARCPMCGGRFRPIMITPTHLKDYRNPHIAALWFRAERELQRCTHVFFVGYSLPWDDVDVIYLLKRGLIRQDGKSPSLTVVEHSEQKVLIEEHDAGRRYLAVFGRKIDWQPIGFKAWVKTVTAG